MKQLLNLRRAPMITSAPQFGYKTVYRWQRDPKFEEEKRVYAEKMSEMRKKHAQEFWERQTQVENAYLERFQTERAAKQRRDLDKWRTAICNISMHTKKQIKDLQSKESAMLEKMRHLDLKKTKKAMDNKLMLDVMQSDSKKWPTLSTLNEKINENVVLPQTILNYGEYQQKLQNLAFFAEQGDHEAMQKLLDKEDVIEKKNVLLQPIFRDLKSAIRHMTYTEEFKVFKEYLDNRAVLIKEYGGEESQKCKEGLKLLQQEYARLVHSQKQALKENPGRRLKVLQKRLEHMFQLLSLWTQYVEVIYMPESDIHIMSVVEKMDPRADDAAFGARSSEIETRNRINTLFAPEQEAADVDKENYETVNEGMTTDTTEAPEVEMRRESAQVAAEPEEETGILSSDEEEVATKAKVVADKPLTNDHSDDIHSFESSPLFQSDKAKEEVENRYNFGETDLDRFGDRLKAKQSKSDDQYAASKTLLL